MIWIIVSQITTDMFCLSQSVLLSSFMNYHSMWPINRFLTWVACRVPIIQQELLAISKSLSSSPLFYLIFSYRCNVSWIIVCIFVLLISAIVLSFLIATNYPHFRYLQEEFWRYQRANQNRFVYLFLQIPLMFVLNDKHILSGFWLAKLKKSLKPMG